MKVITIEDQTESHLQMNASGKIHIELIAGLIGSKIVDLPQGHVSSCGTIPKASIDAPQAEGILASFHPGTIVVI